MTVRIATTTALCAMTLCFAGEAGAGVVFHVNDAAGFATAVAALTHEGTEDFEESTLAAESLTSFNDPLAPGVANGPFPAGTLLAPGVTVQSNTLAGSPATTSPSGSLALSQASAGYFGTPSDQVSNNFWEHSTDYLFAPASGDAVAAVGLAPLFFHGSASSATSNPGTLEIRVYGADGTTLLGTQTVAGVDYSGTDFLGIVATGGDAIGRINLWDGNGSSHWQGADDIAVYTVAMPVGLLRLGVE